MVIRRHHLDDRRAFVQRQHIHICATFGTVCRAAPRVYLGVDETDGGFGPDVLLVAGGGRGVEAQHSIV